MANLHITEFSTQARDSTFGAPLIPAPQMPPVAEQTVAIAGSSAASSAFNAATMFVCLTPKADCHVAFGGAPTATTSLMPLTAGQAYYFGVTPGHKVAVIAAA